MKIAITGASGFIGKHLVARFINKGYDVVALSHVLFKAENQSELKKMVTGAHVIINLAGATISHKWTEGYKQEIISSRVDVTAQLVEVVNSLSVKPRVFISTSAVGYYASDNKYDEYNSKKGDTFLSDVCEAWEQEAKKISYDIRCVIPRFGVVLSRDGGAFKEMTKTFKYGFAAYIGDGMQYISWIDIEDLMRAYEFVIDNTNVWGVVNFTTVTPVAYKDMIKTVAAHCNIKHIVKVPAFAFKLMQGEASSLVLESLKVYPTKLTNAGFNFESKNITQFLNNVFI